MELNGRFEGEGSGLVSRVAGISPRIVGTTYIQLVHLVLERRSLQPKALCCPALAGYSSGDRYQCVYN
ncbi:MAG: hypothetical protein WAN72_25180, partial [Candidatus Acidiferrales bacterium]